MPASRQFEVRAEPDCNLLRVYFIGDVTPEGMKACVATVKTALGKLRPGFTVLTDLSRQQSMALDCVTPLTRMMDLFRTAGAATVIRVIPDPAKDIGFNILALTHYRGKIRVVKYADAAEAEAHLPRPRAATDKAGAAT